MNSIKKSRIKRVLESLDKDRRKAYSGNEDPLTKGEKSQELFRTAAQELVNVLPPSNRQ